VTQLINLVVGIQRPTKASFNAAERKYKNRKETGQQII